jgi:hypothetical protein
MNNYTGKIELLMIYFGISEQASKYLFHRRRRGYPYKKEGDHNYIQWNTQIQNSFIKLDKTDIDWSKIKFNDDINVLMKHGIVVDNQPKVVVINETKQMRNANLNRRGLPLNMEKIYNRDINIINDNDDDNDDEWTVVVSNRNKRDDKRILRKMGFLPQSK